ncbi:MAG: hypothetical protein M1834_005256 [Cirrosporium novae-zelandiae]|nr:MAG: hypothetical protein M1834_005256 [Cirrosporium novae-zelandiae]
MTNTSHHLGSHSSTSCVIQLEPLSNEQGGQSGMNCEEGKSEDTEVQQNTESNSSSSSSSSSSTPSTAVSPVQTWNNPRINIWRLLSTFISFIVMGANDAAYGALIPYLEKYYNVTYTTVSLIFLSPVIGYTASAILINPIHTHLGQRGIAFLGPGSHLISFIITAVHPPFPVLVVVYILAGFGNGTEDGAWNAWIGGLAKSNEILGLLHGFYGLGATLSPLIATSMITKANLKWYTFYYLMIAISTIELVTSVYFFRHANGAAFLAQNPRQHHSHSSSNTPTKPPRPIILRALSHPTTSIMSFFLLIYVGIEVSLGGWLTTFMLRIRLGTPFSSGLVSTGFWLGITLGRVTLGFLTPRLGGVRLAVPLYLLCALILQILFWRIPNFVASAVFVSFVGYCLGPMFPAAVVAATERLPRDLHVVGVGFLAALGSAGACILPFAVGAAAEAKGVGVLQPIVVGLMGGALGLWFCLPGRKKGEEEEGGRRNGGEGGGGSGRGGSGGGGDGEMEEASRLRKMIALARGKRRVRRVFGGENENEENC